MDRLLSSLDWCHLPGARTLACSTTKENFYNIDATDLTVDNDLKTFVDVFDERRDEISTGVELENLTEQKRKFETIQFLSKIGDVSQSLEERHFVTFDGDDDDETTTTSSRNVEYSFDDPSRGENDEEPTLYNLFFLFWNWCAGFKLRFIWLLPLPGSDHIKQFWRKLTHTFL